MKLKDKLRSRINKHRCIPMKPSAIWFPPSPKTFSLVFSPIWFNFVHNLICRPVHAEVSWVKRVNKRQRPDDRLRCPMFQMVPRLFRQPRPITLPISNSPCPPLGCSSQQKHIILLGINVLKIITCHVAFPQPRSHHPQTNIRTSQFRSTMQRQHNWCHLQNNIYYQSSHASWSICWQFDKNDAFFGWWGGRRFSLEMHNISPQ